MLRVGLTGGIGAGKSTVSRRWAERGAVVVDADLIAREVVAPGTPGLAQLVERFGDGILDADGALDRPALAAVAFADPAERAALNAVLHPLIGARTAELVAAAPADAVVVQDIPLLVEGRMAPLFHLVVVVHTDADERVQRLVGQRGMTAEDARARIGAQASDEQRRAAADVWLDNGGAPDSLLAEVDQLWERRLVPYEANVRLHRPVEPTDLTVVDADPEWAAQGARLVARLRVAAGLHAQRIDHVGPTAVPGLAAPDVLDVQVTVAQPDDVAALVQPLVDAGFAPLEEQPVVGGDRAWAEAHHAGADPDRPVHVAVRVAGAPAQRHTLLLVDWLRTEPAVAEELVAAQRAAAARAGTAAEHRRLVQDWIEQTAGRAREWAERTAWEPTTD
ncbi:dephospho-CoA kinase [Rhodococcus sp. X156]|uniref:dephospho-CoA kinase n=1 Tax=Rhodococcus sp. X156 TaxID=2499145 RepID=UPI000FDA3F32|nr:dephospho-CoA kinase [Rhodococcus sp. X156]